MKTLKKTNLYIISMVIKGVILHLILSRPPPRLCAFYQGQILNYTEPLTSKDMKLS